MGSAEVQGVLWDAGAEDWAELPEPMGAPLYEAAFDAMAAGNGTRLLDVRAMRWSWGRSGVRP